MSYLLVIMDKEGMRKKFLEEHPLYEKKTSVKRKKNFIVQIRTYKMKKGFACMDPERRRQICSLAGKKAHALGKAHEYTSHEARKAGRQGNIRQGKIKL